MKRKIVEIDEALCNGCELCVSACHEGALQMIDGKAKLVSESYCDGLGDCLPDCPTGAITLLEREADAYDEEAVNLHMEKNKKPVQETSPCGCPGIKAKVLNKTQPVASPCSTTESTQSQLGQWPCQIKLVPVNAPYLEGAHLLIAASCTAYAYANIHQQFMRNKITLIGCPKLDEVDYSEKLTAILTQRDIKSLTLLRMEVPCCGGLVQAVKTALQNSKKVIPWNVVTISTEGSILQE